MRLHIYKIKEGKKDKLEDWAHELSTIHKEEALETLREEKVTREFLALFQISGMWYAMGAMEGECLPSTDRELNRKHKEIIRDCLVFESEARTEYDFQL